MFRTRVLAVVTLAFGTVGVQSVRADGFMSYAPFSGKVEFMHTNDHLNVQPGMKVPQKGKPKPAIPSSYTMNVGTPIHDVWHSLRLQLTRDLPKVLKKEYVKGVSAYDVKSNLNQNGKLEFWLSNDQLSLRYTIPGNSLTATLTTPDINAGPISIGLGKYADPRVEINFDVQVTIGMKFQLHGAPVINQASAVILNTKLVSQNLSGDILNGANELVKFVGGPDFKSKAESMMNGQGGDVAKLLNQFVQKANPAVAALSRDAKSMTSKFDGKEVVIAYSALPPKKIVIK